MLWGPGFARPRLQTGLQTHSQREREVRHVGIVDTNWPRQEAMKKLTVKVET